MTHAPIIAATAEEVAARAARIVADGLIRATA